MRILSMPFHRRFIVLTLSMTCLLAGLTTCMAQLPVNSPAGKPTKQKSDDSVLLRWKIVLDSLAQEAKTVAPEDRRPYAIVDVANAYWEVDRELSRSIFITALDAAVALSKQDKKYRPLLNYVLSAATRRDAILAKELNKRLVDDKDANDRDNISSQSALDLLGENPDAAARLAEAFAPNGLHDGSAVFFIFSLAKKDTRLSDVVYNAYLSKVSTNENIPLEQIIYLAGYSFGYAEYFSVDRRGQLAGASFLPITDLSARPSVTASFLSLAFRRISKSIERRDNAVGADIEELNFPILFATQYLIPEVGKFAPSTLPAWHQLQQQAIISTTVQQNQQITKYIQQINQGRVRTREYSDGSQTPEQEAEASLEDVEKVVGTCQRDVIYTKAALTFNSRKNTKRALEIAGKIEDLKQSARVKETILMNTAQADIENGDFEDAQKKVEKIASLEHRAIFYAKLAQAMTKKTGSDQNSEQAINDGIKLIEKLSEAKYRAGFLFSLSAILLRADPPEAQSLIAKAIKNLNKQEPSDRMNFSIPLRVPVSCAGEQESWYGGSWTLPNSNVLDALTLLAKQNPDEASRSAEEIDDKITRIRSLAMITGLALKSAQAASVSKDQVVKH
ncbi:MAG: hypothetical protein ABL999_03495 [Pyrinomonadaceae bacterium]